VTSNSPSEHGPSGYDPQDEVGSTGGRPKSAKRRRRTIPVVVVLVALIAAFLVGRLTAPKTTNTTPVAVSSAQPSPTLSVQPSAAATTIGTAAAAGSTASSSSNAAAAGASPGPAASGIGTVNLTDLTPASTTFDDSDTNPLLNGKLQVLAISEAIGQTGDTCLTTNGVAEYNLGRDYTKFTALIGIDDNSANQTLAPTVEIDGDGLKLALYTPTLGHPSQVSVNVTNVLRLDIKWTDPGATCTVNYLVVGDGQLTTIPGYTPPAPSPSS
jgi:hypothetical protein